MKKKMTHHFSSSSSTLLDVSSEASAPRPELLETEEEGFEEEGGLGEGEKVWVRRSAAWH
jgi:hypothetical protein